MNEKILGEKTAAFDDAVRSMGEHFGGAAMHGAGGAIAAGGVALIGVAASKLFDAATKSRDFKQMLEANPDLHEQHTMNPHQFNQMFTSLRTMNPEFSKDPLVAGEYMRRMTSDPVHAGGYLTETVQSRDRFSSPIMDTYLKGGLEGLKGGNRSGMGGPGGRPGRPGARPPSPSPSPSSAAKPFDPHAYGGPGPRPGSDYAGD